jgi:nitroreductase
MDALEAILTRRSVRRYTDEQIDDETTQKLLAAAMSAPSAANEQPWEFIVIRDRARCYPDVQPVCEYGEARAPWHTRLR